MASSWGRGTRPAPPVPPEPRNHFVESLHAPVSWNQCKDTAGVKVMLLLPPQSPRIVPVKGAAAPAPTISVKSTLVRLTTAAVRVCVVPGVNCCPVASVAVISTYRREADKPVTLRVPEIVDDDAEAWQSSIKPELFAAFMRNVKLRHVTGTLIVIVACVALPAVMLISLYVTDRKSAGPAICVNVNNEEVFVINVTLVPCNVQISTPPLLVIVIVALVIFNARTCDPPPEKM